MYETDNDVYATKILNIQVGMQLTTMSNLHTQKISCMGIYQATFIYNFILPHNGSKHKKTQNRTESTINKLIDTVDNKCSKIAKPNA
jgi:hypothetical protein